VAKKAATAAVVAGGVAALDAALGALRIRPSRRNKPGRSCLELSDTVALLQVPVGTGCCVSAPPRALDV
jgi:hypothetical protein